MGRVRNATTRDEVAKLRADMMREITTLRLDMQRADQERMRPELRTGMAGLQIEMTAMGSNLVKEMTRLQSRGRAVQTATNLATVLGVISLVLLLVR